MTANPYFEELVSPLKFKSEIGALNGHDIFLGTKIALKRVSQKVGALE